MSEEFARLYIANLEKRRYSLIECNGYMRNAIILQMLDMQINAIKETMLEMGHKL